MFDMFTWLIWYCADVVKSLMGALKQQSNGPYSSTVIGTLAVESGLHLTPQRPVYQLHIILCGTITRVARFLAAKYGRLLSIHDVRQGQYDAIS